MIRRVMAVCWDLLLLILGGVLLVWLGRLHTGIGVDVFIVVVAMYLGVVAGFCLPRR